MLIYRFETDYGRGVYHNDVTDAVQYDRSRHPMPFEDDIPRWNDLPTEEQLKHRFGFSSIPQLDNWFNETERSLLREKGVVLKIYDVDDEHVLVGDSQAVFKYEYAEEIMKIDPVTLC